MTLAALLEEAAMVCANDSDGITKPYAWPPRPPLSDDELHEVERLRVLGSRMYYRAWEERATKGRGTMIQVANAKLVEALIAEESACRSIIDQLRALPMETATENRVHDLTARIRLAVDLVGCLRRLVPGRPVEAIHASFGAPGDFGYESPIGDALARIYRGEP